MRTTILTLAIILLTCTYALGQKRKCPRNAPDSDNCNSFSTLAANGETKSPIEPRMRTDSRFVENSGNGLDTGCLFRPEGPLVITVPITRVVGETNANGNLLFHQDLVNNGIVSATVTFRMPAWDVDLAGAPGLPPEIDNVLLNGVSIGQLTGSNNTWKLNEFTVPVEHVRFAKKNGTGEPIPGNNVITIMIDQGSGQDINWCTEIDWVEVSFTAAYPVVLIHGNNRCPEFFSGDLFCDNNLLQTADQFFITPFTQHKMLVDTSIRLAPGRIQERAGDLETQIPNIASSYGVKHLHLVAHSSGGLYAREFATRLKTEGGSLGLLSLTTLSTPHLGSAGADYQMDAAGGGKFVAVFSDDPTLTELVRVFLAPNPTTEDLRVSAVTQFNDLNLPKLKDYFIVDGELNVFHRWTVAADANINESIIQERLPEFVPTIQQNETVGISPKFNIPGRLSMLEKVYRTLGVVHYTTLEPRTVGGITGMGVIEHRSGPLQPFELNDFAVTIHSANFMPNITRPASFITYEPANHATISNSTIGTKIRDAVKPIQPRR